MIFGIPLSVQGGAAGLLATVMIAVVVAIMRGVLVPRSVVDDVRADRDARVSAAETRETHYRQALDASIATVHEQSRQLDELLEIARTTSAVIHALPRAVERHK